MKSPHVWGIGLTRTGTTSLNEALCRLGYRSVHWPSLATLLYGDVEAATDESVAAVYRYLDSRYPGSRFILTVRDETSWLASTRRQRARTAAHIEDFLRQNVRALPPDQQNRWVELRHTQMTLYGTTSFNEARFRAGFRKYHAEVAEYFRRRDHDLLRLRVSDRDAMQKLGSFLGRPAPAAPFPHVNAFCAA